MKDRIKYKLIISDLHMGTGYLKENHMPNPLEAFHEDEKLIEFIDYHLKEYTHPIEIIFNGDTFEMVSVDDGKEYPSIIREKTSVEVLDRILNAHREVFVKLREFTSKKENSLTFVAGESDAGIIWPECSSLLKEYISPKTKILMGPYRVSNFHIEHGHQYETIHRFNYKMMFLYRKGERLLNIPFGPFFRKEYIKKIKEKKPYIDRVHPLSSYIKWAMYFDTLFAIKFIAGAVFSFLKIRFIPHPMRYSRISNTLKIIREVFQKQSPEVFYKRILQSDESLQGIITAHTHQPMIKLIGENKVLINSGTWLETINFEIGNLGRKKELTYVEIKDEDINKTARLMVWHGKEHPVENLRQEF